MSFAGSTGNQYRIIADIGRGGTSIVRLAVAEGALGPKRLVVLKSLRAHLAAEESTRKLLLEEAALTCRMSHSNIVQVHEVAIVEGQEVLVMEFLEGQSLAHILQAAGPSSFPLAMHLSVIQGILAGLAYAHALQDRDGTPLHLVHRDVSPQNTFVTYDGRIKLLDFGIAKGRQSTVQTERGVVKGRLGYMAPEQMAGEQLDLRADIYSVGVMLWQAATGEYLWKDHPDVLVMNRVLAGKIPTPREVRSDVDPLLDAICVRALCLDPAARHESAKELSDDIELVLGHLPRRARLGEMGEWVASRFKEERDSIRRTLAEDAERGELSQRRSTTAQVARPLTFTNPPVVPAHVTFTHRWKRWLPLALAVAICALPFWFVRTREPDRRAARLAEDAVPAEPAARQAERVELESQPNTAKLLLDGVELLENPTWRVLPRDGHTHQLRAEAPGYVTQLYDFIPSDGRRVQLRLEPSTPPKVDANVLSRRPGTTTSARDKLRAIAREGASDEDDPKTAGNPPPSPSASANPCALPYFVDERGIKRVNPACLP